MLIAVTVESVLLVLLLVGAAVGLAVSRILLARRRIWQWRKGHAPGHESFMEIPYKRDVVFPIVAELLSGEYNVTTVVRVERLLLGEKPLGKRTERITVRVAPTLEGCEVIFSRLGPGWKAIPKDSNSPEAERLFGALMTRLNMPGQVPGMFGAPDGQQANTPSGQSLQ